MKKIISSLLTVSLAFSGINCTPYEKTVLAQPAEEAVSVTDLSKYENNEVIVVYKKEKNATENKTLSICSLSNSQEEQARVDELTESSVVLRLDSEDALATAVEALSNDSRVDYVQPNYIYKAMDTNVSTVLTELGYNSDFKKQWGYDNDGTLSYREPDYRNGGTGSWWNYENSNSYSSTIEVYAQQNVDINLPEALAACKLPQRETIVAIVDTGIKYNHPELKDFMWINEDEIPNNNVDDDGNGCIDDIHGWNFYGKTVKMGSWPFEYKTGDGIENNTYYNAQSEVEDAHGTHCAGTITAKNDFSGTVGIASKANIKLMTVKALGGEEGYGSTESVIKGIKYAEKNGAAICNLSLGGEDDDLLLRSAIRNSSMLFTIAAGNGDENSNAVNNDTTPTYPACFDYENILSVANLQCNGTLHYSSNYGKKSVHLAAPGSYVYSTSTTSDGYEYMTGTSMAAPMVAGVAAMLYSCYPQYSILDIRNAILSCTQSLEALTNMCSTGGMLDACKAVAYLNSGVSAPTTPKPTTAVTTPRVTATPKVTMAPRVTATPKVTITPRITATPYVTDYPYVTTQPSFTNTPTVAPYLTAAPVSKAPTITKAPALYTPVPYTAALSVDAISISNRTLNIGKTNIISAKVSGATGSYAYRFVVSKSNKVMLDRTTYINSISWTPTTSGTYLIQVYVMDANGDYNFKAITANVSKLKVNQICFDKSLRKGVKVKISTSTTYGISPFVYEFSIYRNGKKLTTKKTNKKQITYKISKTGTYKFKITVKDKHGNKASKTVTQKVKR